jgi:putative ABC transport system permease protein
MLLNLYIKGGGALIGVRDAINRHLRERQVPLIKFKPLSQVRDQWLAPTRLRAWLIGLFGLLALLVTLSGVVGVVSHNVSRRLRELGVRMAVGASPSDIVRSFLIAGLKLLIPGLLLGLALMLAGAPLLQTVLYQTRALNPVVYLLVAAVLSGAVLAAVYAPARKAARLEPRSVLHVE